VPTITIKITSPVKKGCICWSYFSPNPLATLIRQQHQNSKLLKIMKYKRFQFVKWLSSLMALLSFCAITVTAQSLKCGSQAAPPPNGNNPDSLILDRFGNVYDLEDLLVPAPANGPLLGGCASGYFNLVFSADFPMDMRQTVCQVFADLSETIVQHSNTLGCGDVLPLGKVDIDVVWKEITPSVVLGTGTPFSTDITDPTFCPDMILDRPFIKINGGTVNTVGVFDGRLEINSMPKNAAGLTLPWHIDWTTPVGASEIDLYSVTLHEALHILGFASRITLPEYGLWDRIIHTTDNFVPNGGSANIRSLISTHPLTPPCILPVTRNCWHLANGINSGNLQTTVSNTCSANNATPDVVVGESAIAAIDATNTGGLLAQLSHLSETCNGSSEVYVMRSGFDLGMSRRVISGDELSILCELGYEISTPGFPCQGCYNIANFESRDFTDCCYRVYHGCAGQPIEVLEADLLCNDVTNGEPQEIVGVWHPNSSVQIMPNPAANGWLITLGANHAPRLDYAVVGCDCRMHNARFNILLEKQCPPCTYNGDACDNLLCFSDFENYTNTAGIETWLGYPFLIEGNTRVGTPDISVANGNHFLFMGASGGFSNSKEPVVMELNECVPPGCTLTLNADLGRSAGAVSATLNVWGSAQPPCPATVAPVIPIADNCGEVTVCAPGHSFAPTCIGSLPVEVLNNSSFEPINHVTHIWENLTDEDVCYLTLVPSDGSVSLDNISATRSCEPEITCTADVPLGVCQGNSFPLSITICTAEIPGADQTLITPNIALPAGWEITSGSLEPFVLTEAQQCSTINLQVLAPANAPIGSVHSILLSGTAIGICATVEWSCPVSVTVIGCNGADGFSCPCIDAGQINVDATSYSPLYNLNLEGVLWSEYAQANNLPDILDGSIHQGCIAIAGRLIIDRDVEIKSCGEIKMQPCSEIWVGTGQSATVYPSLLLYLNNLYGCEQMWKGITVQQFCMLTMGKNSIEDAQFAVTALGSHLIQPPVSTPTRFYAVTNFFRNNHVGVYIPTNRKQTVLHAPFHYNNFIGRIPGKPLLPPCDASLPNYSDQMGYAGLVTLGTAFDVGTSGSSGYVNTFRDIRNGVIGENDAWVNVYRARFDNVPGYMGINGNPSFAASSGVGVLLRRGICSVKNSRFEGVGHAVFANNTAGLSVLQNQMPDVFTGVQAMATRGFNINENQSIGFRDWGIFTRNPGQLLPLNSELLIEDNYLHSIEDDADGVIEEAGIAVILSNNISDTEDARISGNQLTTRDLQFGILMNTANNWLLDGNTVTIEPLLTNLPHTGTGGITLFSAENNWLYGNTVTDNGTDPSVGIWAASAAGNTYCCNTTSLTNWGAYFQGSCDNTTLRELFTDGNDDFALECTPGTVISDQPNIFLSPGDNHSNQFHIGSNAQHGRNDGQVQNSEFFVRTNVPLDHPENVFLPNIPGGYDPANPNWFFATGFANKDCNATGGCPPPEYGEPRNRDSELSETDTYFASGEFLGSPYGDALNWEGKLRLYKRMQEYPELAGQSATVDAFFTNAGNNIVGMYAVVDGAIASINALPQPWEAAIQNAQMAVQTAITAAESQLAALAFVSTWEDSMVIYRASELTRFAAIPAYESLMQYLHLADSLRSTKTQAAWALNQALSATDILQSNRKTVNRVYLETVGQGITALTPAQFDDIAPIAWQCPLEGGGVVYTARGLYQMHTAAHFDDRSLCGLGSQERGAQRANAPLYETLKVQPNPASGELLVALPMGVVGEELRMKVIDVNGREVLSNQVTGDATILIDVSKLPAGLHTLSAIGKSKTLAPVKFVVQH
jgi:hypothetical protein